MRTKSRTYHVLRLGVLAFVGRLTQRMMGRGHSVGYLDQRRYRFGRSVADMKFLWPIGCFVIGLAFAGCQQGECDRDSDCFSMKCPTGLRGYCMTTGDKECVCRTPPDDPAICGNGQLEDPEACDDGNSMNGDGCSAGCQIEGAGGCPAPDACTEMCGNDTLEDPETCDDGNTVDTDGCSADCLIEDGWECPADGACTEECGDGLVVGSEECDPGDETGPACTEFCTLAAELSILSAELSPPIPEGVDGLFSGVTQYILVQPSSAEVSVWAQCEIAGVPCTQNFDVSIPSGDPVLAQVTLPSNMAPDDYDFEFWATSGGLTSDPLFPLQVLLQLGSGELKCERWSDAAPGNAEERWIALQLQEPNGTPRTDVEFYVYNGTTNSRGWDLRMDWPKREARGDIRGNPISIPTTTRFLAMAVDRSTSPPTFMAAREFRWNQSPAGLTKGCRPCNRGTGGNCLIIPLN